ncbi:hypothetical protein Q011_03087, partial [Pseudomonas aeruginosa 6077]
LSHYTDWTIGHVHAGALGWVAMITIGSLYHLIPKVYGVEKMHSVGLINAHFWLATIGTVLYIRHQGRQGLAERQDRNGRRGRLPAGARHLDQEQTVTAMDIGTLRGLGTLLIMVAFIGLVIWAYSGKRKKSFDEATMLPFADDPEAKKHVEQASRSNKE